MDNAARIAGGGEPPWQETFTHPRHGKLTFSVERTPTNADWLRQGIEQARIAPGIAAGGDSGALLLAGSIAGLRTMLSRPVIREDRTPDPEIEGREVIEKVLYDPLEDDDMAFPIIVWTSYLNWRSEQLGSTEQVKNSSGAMSLAGSGGASPAPTDSLQTTLA